MAFEDQLGDIARRHGELVRAGGPAYPTQSKAEGQYPDASAVAAGYLPQSQGMTLRDRIAIGLLPGAFAAGLTAEEIAQQCYAVADAMLAERAKGQGA
jgi:hypothetical protein